jgi:quercetin dioxygenase-like cupin family protein
MPILRFEDAPEFDLSGIRIRGLASPSRGATETMTYRVELAGGQRLPNHTHDHEEVSHVVSGRWTVSIEGEETPLGPGDTVVIPAGVTHGSSTREGDEAVILTSMPVGTVIFRPGGERVSPPWGE